MGHTTSHALATPAIPPSLAWSVLVLAGAVLAVLVLLGFHRAHLLALARRPAPREADEEPRVLPVVTVQLPVYNEAAVVRRLIDAVAALDYPRDRLEVQVLDDSTDETTARVRERVAHWRSRGVDIEHVRRPRREGFKAGALREGTERCRGDFVLILDADFVPRPGLVRRLLPPFHDAGVGMVQARWDHLNEDAGLLTRCQTLLLDGHFFVEHGGRYRAGRFLNFNGTAGMWRREALESVGGWSAETLTEDLDLSYRCQMAGWRFAFLEDVGVPAEVPEEVRALEGQQKRWAQGGVQTARKVLPRLLGGGWPVPVKLEGVFHLGGHVAYPLTLLLGVLLLPSAVARSSLGLDGLLVLDLLVFGGATLSFLAFFAAAGRRRGRPWHRLLPRAVATLALGVGLTAACSRAVVRGLRGGRGDPFQRTPKRGDGPPRYRSPAAAGDRGLKALLAAWMAASSGAAVLWGYWTTLPFLVLFATGYTWLLLGDGEGLRAAGRAEPAERGEHASSAAALRS